MNPDSTRTTVRVAAGLAALLALGLGLRGALAAKESERPTAAIPAKPSEAADKGEAAGGDAGPSAYPVVTTHPVSREFHDVVRGYGTVRADARSARSVTNATQGVVSAVLVLPGERVRRGQALVHMEPDPLAYLAYQQAASAEKLARREVDRLAAQRADNLATAAQLESAQKSLADATAAVEAARRQGADSGLTVLRAPIEGIVTSLGIVAGDRPAIGSAIATVSPAADRVALGIEPGLQNRVRVGDHVTIHTVQTDDSPRSGHVVQVGASLDPDTRLVIVSVVLDPTRSQPLLAGIAVEGVIDTRTVAAYSLPRTALVKGDDGLSVFEVRDGKAHRVAVTVVSDDGPRVGVTGEFDGATSIVTTGAYELDDGVDVVEQKP